MCSNGHLNTAGVNNWIKALLAFKYGKLAIHSAVKNGVTHFRDSVLSKCPTNNCDKCATYCITSGRAGRPQASSSKAKYMKRVNYCPNSVCDVLCDAIIGADKLDPTWFNTDATKWCSSPLEVAKCFMPKGYDKISSFEEIDFTGFMSVFINAKFMQNVLLPGSPTTVMQQVTLGMIISVIVGIRGKYLHFKGFPKVTIFTKFL